MPERWERELKKWGSVRAPARMRARVEDGPKGDGMPPIPDRGQRVLAGVVAFAVFGAAVWLAAGGFGRGDVPGPLVTTPASVILTLAAGANEPEGTLAFDGVSAGVSADSYCWNAQGCVDVVLQPFAASDFLPVPQGTAFVLDNPDGADPVVLVVAPGDDPSVTGRATTLEDLGALAPGRYVLSVTASWPGRGDHITFHFALEIATPGASPAIDTGEAVIHVERSPLRITLEYGGQQQTAIVDDTWIPGGGEGFPGRPIDAPDSMVFRSFLVVPPGTPFRVEGGLEGWATSSSDPTHLPKKAGPVVWTLRGGWSDLEFDASFGLFIAEPGTSVTVPDLTGIGDQAALVRLDGVGLRWEVVFVPAPGAKEWSVIASEPVAGTEVPPGTVVRIEVATVITPLPVGAEDALSCPADEHVAFGGPRMRLTPGGAAYIVGNLGGIDLRTDEVVQATFGARQWDGIWHVIRNARVIAVVDFDSLDGVACAGSGVAGV